MAMNEFSSRPLSDFRRTDPAYTTSSGFLNALPGLKTLSRASELSNPSIISFHLSTIFNLCDNLEDETLNETDPSLGNDLKNLGMYDIGLFGEITRYVGQGATFNVRRTIFPDSRDVVLKTRVFDPKQDEGKSFMEKIEAILLELRVLAHTPLRQHQNIVQLLAIGWQGDAFDPHLKWPVLIVEYADRGTLADFLENEDDLDARTRFSIFGDFTAGLQALHDCFIVHGDLKLLNVLICSSDNGSIIAKLSDFGGSLLDSNASFVEPMGTPPWAAPEYRTVRSRENLLLSDVYALGLLLWRVILGGGDPFDNFNLSGQSRSREQVAAAILRLKREDKLLSMAKESIRRQELEFDVRLIDCIFDVTLQAIPEKRSLETVRRIMQSQERQAGSKNELDRLPNDKIADTDINETEPDLLLSLAGLQFDNVSSALSEPVLNAFEYTAAHDTILERRADAASILARMYLGCDSFGLQEDVNKGLAYLVQAALASSCEDAVLVLRLHHAFGHELPLEAQTSISQWLLGGGMTGSMTALEDMQRFGFVDEWSHARSQSRTRYCGYGEEIFEWGEGSLTRMSDPFSSDGMNYIRSEIESGADIHDSSPSGCRPLLFAARSGHIQALLALLTLGADPRIGDEGNETSLHWLCAFDDSDVELVVDQLIEYGANVDSQAKAFPLDRDLEYAETEYVSGTPLHRAVCRNKLVAVRKLLSVGANRNAPAEDDIDRTPIVLAAQLHYADILEECLRLNASETSTPGCSLTTPSVRSLLISAMDGGSLHSMHIGMLIRHGDKMAAHAKATMSVLFRSGIENHAIDLPGQPGCSAILYASNCLPHILETLVELTGISDLDRPSRRHSKNDYYDLNDAVKHRPIFKAILLGKIPTLFKLLELNADPLANYNDDSGLSALYQCAASSVQDLKVAQELCQRGLGVDDGPEDFESPFCCAVRNGCYVLANFLRSKGANVNKPSAGGLLWRSSWPLTLLGLLASNNQPSSVAGLQFLLDHKASTRVELVTDPVLHRTVLHILAMLDGNSHDGLTTSRTLELIDSYFCLDNSALDTQTLPHENGSDGSVEAQGGNTALHLAVIHANFETVVFLLEKGAITSIHNAMGMTPLDLAALSYPNFEIHFERQPVPASFKRQLHAARERRTFMQLLLDATPGGVNQDILEKYTLDNNSAHSQDGSEVSDDSRRATKHNAAPPL